MASLNETIYRLGRYDELEALEQEQRDLQEQVQELREEADQKQVITAAETRLDSLRGEEARVAQSIEVSESRVRELRELLADLETRIDAARREYGDVERALASAQQETLSAEASLQAAREARESAAGELARLESRHDIAARIASELEGFRAGAAALLRDSRSSVLTIRSSTSISSPTSSACCARG